MTEQIRLTSTLSKAIAVILVAGFACWAAPMQDSGPSKELLQWVREARKTGKPEEQIRKDAALAGWQEGAVNDALRATSAESPAKVTGEAMPAAANGASQPARNSQTGLPNADGAGAASIAPAEAGSAEAGSKDVANRVRAAGSASPPPPEKPGASIDKAPPVDRGVPDDYQIGAGDILHIGVFHEPDATVQSVVVRTDGKISMPLIKEVAVLGLTPSQLEKQITEQLSKFIPAPDVTVIVMAINSKKIYVIGAVRREGPLQYTYPMNVLQALTEAGGLTDFAKRKKIYVLRNKNGREFKLPFDYDAVLKGEHMELNVPLIASDTIVVPGSQ
jgi:polysaccharide export outer membrane protein